MSILYHSNFITFKDFLAIGNQFIKIANLFPVSFYNSLKYKKEFDAVKTYCMFIGFSRSGKTMIASLLDAHPNIIISDEADALKYVHLGFSRRQIYYLLLKNSKNCAHNGRISKGYSYKIPNQWQGEFEQLHVIGDNNGELVTLRLRTFPELLQRLRNKVGVKVKLIHVVRNPYDNISALLSRQKLALNLRGCITHYFSLCETLEHILGQQESSDVFSFRHELFIDNPRKYLKDLCRFLDVFPSEDYLRSCESIICPTLAHRNRYDVSWENEFFRAVEAGIERFPFLRGYSYKKVRPPDLGRICYDTNS